MEEHAFSETTGLPEKSAKPASIDDRNDAAGYCPAFLYPIRERGGLNTSKLRGLV
jgi:hypothetical protein